MFKPSTTVAEVVWQVVLCNLEGLILVRVFAVQQVRYQLIGAVFPMFRLARSIISSLCTTALLNDLQLYKAFGCDC
jgi:hypothetical protein